MLADLVAADRAKLDRLGQQAIEIGLLIAVGMGVIAPAEQPAEG